MAVWTWIQQTLRAVCALDVSSTIFNANIQMKNKTFMLERRRDKCAFCTRPQNYSDTCFYMFHIHIAPPYLCVCSLNTEELNIFIKCLRRIIHISLSMYRCILWAIWKYISCLIYNSHSKGQALSALDVSIFIYIILFSLHFHSNFKTFEFYNNRQAIPSWLAMPKRKCSIYIFILQNTCNCFYY